MNSTSGIIYYHDWNPTVAQALPKVTLRSQPRKKAEATAKKEDWSYIVALGCIALSLGGLIGPLSPMLRLEGQFALSQSMAYAKSWLKSISADKAPQVQNPIAPVQVLAASTKLETPDGSSIDPVDTQFGIVIPKIGVNARILASINPTKPEEYTEAMKQGIAHASTSFFPDENGTVYLFSHSTNSDWFVRDLNAIFYLLKNLEPEDKIVLFYKEKQYTYKITDKKIVSPSAVSYLVPQKGMQKLILQTCWPPGSTAERLLIFADLIENGQQIESGL